MLPFNIPYTTGDEQPFIEQAVRGGYIAGNGEFSRKCRQQLQKLFRFDDVFLSPSGTAALEMAALLCEFQPGDEVILPAYTHVSTANAFQRAGAVLRFADSQPDHPNIDADSVHRLINGKTKALVIVHYAGVASCSDELMTLVKQHSLILIEDAAHALGSKSNEHWLGSQGHLAAFSFHETKNIHCGQGGMLVVNDKKFRKPATEIWHHGTNRSEFDSGSVPSYQWMRPGGAYMLSELNASFLYAQLLHVDRITSRRLKLWNHYYDLLKPLEDEGLFRLPQFSIGKKHNGHIFYLSCKNENTRDGLIQYLKEKEVQAVFHYMTLHNSPYWKNRSEITKLSNAEKFGKTIVRLPLYYELSHEKINFIVGLIKEYAGQLQTA